MPNLSATAKIVLARKRQGIFYAFVALWVALFFLPLLYLAQLEPRARIGNLRLDLEYADTLDERRTGLSGRDNLPTDRGMLFVFEEPDRYGFWMKDMQFPLDILWLDENYAVVHIEKNVPPEGSEPSRTYTPPVPALYVLEINAGYSDAYDISVGDVLNPGVLSDTRERLER